MREKPRLNALAIFNVASGIHAHYDASVWQQSSADNRWSRTSSGPDAQPLNYNGG